MRIYRRYRTVANLYSSLKDCERDLYLINQYIENVKEEEKDYDFDDIKAYIIELSRLLSNSVDELGLSTIDFKGGK